MSERAYDLAEKIAAILGGEDVTDSGKALIVVLGTFASAVSASSDDAIEGIDCIAADAKDFLSHHPVLSQQPEGTIQ